MFYYKNIQYLNGIINMKRENVCIMNEQKVYQRKQERRLKLKRERGIKIREIEQKERDREKGEK